MEGKKGSLSISVHLSLSSGGPVICPFPSGFIIELES
jgi:hypothetical protein